MTYDEPANFIICAPTEFRPDAGEGLRQRAILKDKAALNRYVGVDRACEEVRMVADETPQTVFIFQAIKSIPSTRTKG